MYELFEHTADLGLRVRAPDLNTLFADAAAGLFSIIVEDMASIVPRDERHTTSIPFAGDLDYLLFDWLDQCLKRFEQNKWLYSRFAVQVREDGLEASLWGEPYDPARHELSHEVKAITYHELKVEQTADGWLAEVIVDI